MKAGHLAARRSTSRWNHAPSLFAVTSSISEVNAMLVADFHDLGWVAFYPVWQVGDARSEPSLTPRTTSTPDQEWQQSRRIADSPRYPGGREGRSPWRDLGLRGGVRAGRSSAGSGAAATDAQQGIQSENVVAGSQGVIGKKIRNPRNINALQPFWNAAENFLHQIQRIT